MRSLLAAAEFNHRRRKRKIYLMIAAMVAAITLGVAWCERNPGEGAAGLVRTRS